MKLLLVLRRFAGMVAIRHNDVINGAVAEYHGTRRACHRRRVDKNLVFPDRQEEPVEIELLLLREPGPLPDAGKKLFHWKSRSRLRLRPRLLLNLSLGLNIPKERIRHL